MAKLRLYEAAKELNLTSAELKERLSEMGIEVTSNFQQVDADVIKRLKNGDPPKSSGAEAKPKAKPKPKAEAKPAEPRAEPKPQAKPAVPEPEPVTDAAAQAPDPPVSVQMGSGDGGRETAAAEAPLAAEKTAASATSLVLLELPEGVTVGNFADAVGRSPADIITRLIGLGEMVTINQAIDPEVAHVLGEDLGFDVHIKGAEEEALEEEDVESHVPAEPRAPVVTVMGHVDHGKTSLLDAVRETDVTAKEAGGITQHIGAYQVVHNHHRITFIDTPGHEAFTAMRARGARVTDVAVLVVAADDGVKAQTVEALNHAQAAGVPIVVAINKIDKPEANVEKVKRELAELNLVPEDWGGQTVMVEVSAKQGLHLEDLLEMIVLVTEMQELKSPRDVRARGVVIEAQLTKGRGPVATVLVQAGTLTIGDIIVAGSTVGRVRAMSDERGKPVKKALPSQPVEVVGLSTTPAAGDEFIVVKDERRARQVVEDRQHRDQQLRRGTTPTTQAMLAQMGEGEVAELRLILKADVQGSLEALRDAVEKEQHEEVRTSVIHKGVGAISETDVMLAAASQGVVIGFNVRPDPKARDMAERESVDIRLYQVIYQAVQDIRAAGVGLLKPQVEEEEVGRVEVRTTFKVPKIGLVAGCYVTEGEVNRTSLVRLVRDGVVVYDGRVGSLRRFKDDVQTVKSGFECGVGLEGFRDIKDGDVMELYKKVEVPRE